MCRLIIPALLHYVYIPTLVASLALALIILFSNSKSPANRNLFWVVILCCYWNVVSFLGYTVTNVQANLWLARSEILFVFGILFFLYFSYFQCGGNLTWKEKILFALPFLPIVALAPTDFNSFIINPKTCETQGGYLYWYVYLILVVYAGWSIWKLISSCHQKGATEEARRQTKIIIGAIVFMVFWFISCAEFTRLAFMRGYIWADEIFLYVPVGIVIFIGILSLAMVKYRFLKIKIIAAEVLGAGLLVTSGTQVFFVQDSANRILAGIASFLSLIFGIFLIRSIEGENKKKNELEVANQEISLRKNELQKMSVELDKSNTQLRELDNAKSEFISIASHQLRTPLSVIKGYVSMLLEGSYGELDKLKQDVLDKIFTNNERLVVLVEDLLDISRIESGRMEFNFSQFQLEKLCQEVFDLFQMKAKKNNLEFKFEKPAEELPQVMIDGAKIHEVICNLVDNAIKYCPKGGVTLKVERNGDFERIIVSDTGIGIEHSNLPYLFAKFSRGKDSNRLTATGTGLGLYVGRSIVEANGGKIWAESEGKDKGSKFIVEIPIKQDPKIIKKWS